MHEKLPKFLVLNSICHLTVRQVSKYTSHFSNPVDSVLMVNKFADRSLSNIKLSSIKRRDFLNGVAITSAAAAINPSLGFAKTQQSYDYPPIKTGIRGSHEGSYEAAHALAWEGRRDDNVLPLEEHYDLIIVGAGISGLASAHYYLKYKPKAKILIIDNHDDFGGHAKRNEFHVDGRMYLCHGGSMNLEYQDYDEIMNAFIGELGIDIKKLRSSLNPSYGLGSLDQENAIYFDAATYGKNRIVKGHWLAAWHEGGTMLEKLLQQSPLSQPQQQQLLDLANTETDYLADLSATETWNYLKHTSYQQFLTDKVKLPLALIALFEPFIKTNNAVGLDALPALECIPLGPGLKGLGLLGPMLDSIAQDQISAYKAAYFPDGNASIPRLLVGKLIPDVNPAAGKVNLVAETITARFDYDNLDLASNQVRIRLNSTAVKVENSEGITWINYSQNGKIFRLSSERMILACYNGIIPHICPELPEPQKAHLRYGVKFPLVYTSVLISNAKAFWQGKSNLYQCPNSTYSVVSTAPEVALGSYEYPKSDEDTLVLHMMHIPAPKIKEGQTMRDSLRAGRYILYQKPFSTYAEEVATQLNAMFGDFGFDATRDIKAITVNRWSHGYSYAYNSLFDPEFPEGQAPHVLGRKPIGKISIANSDSEAEAYVSGAVTSAWRAVKEQLFAIKDAK